MKKYLLPVLLVAMFVLVLQGVSAAVSLNDCTDNSSLDIEVDFDDDNLGAGDDIKVTLTFVNDGNFDIEDIDYEYYFTPDLEDDSEDNIEDEDTIDVDEDDEEEVELDWTPNQDFDDGDSFTFVVKARGKDADNSSRIVCAINDDEVLEFEKNKFDLEIYKITSTPTSVQCSRNVNVRVGVRNIGAKNVDDAVLKLSSSELDIDETANLAELDKDSGDDDNSLEKAFSLKIPESVPAGTYTINANLEYENAKYTKFKGVDLEVKKCEPVKNETRPVTPTETTVIVQPPTTTITPTTPTTAATTIPPLVVEEKTTPFNTLVIVIIAFEILIVLVGIVLIAKWAKR